MKTSVCGIFYTSYHNQIDCNVNIPLIQTGETIVEMNESYNRWNKTKCCVCLCVCVAFFFSFPTLNEVSAVVSRLL